MGWILSHGPFFRIHPSNESYIIQAGGIPLDSAAGLNSLFLHFLKNNFCGEKDKPSG